jgi:GntR family transcriptional repressor for pyruvate dehydrogenase complex
MSNHLQLEPPQRVTVVESIIEQILTQIQNGTLKPGDRLPSERELAEMLQVGRSSVREALQGLSAMDLVEGRPGQGTFVKEVKSTIDFSLDAPALSSALQKEMHRHFNEARSVLEQEIVTLAVERLTDQDKEAILQALEAYETHAGSELTPEFWQLHDQIHLAIAQSTGNLVLVRMLQSLLDFVPRVLRSKDYLTDDAEETQWRAGEEQKIHRQLCLAVTRRDGSAAREWIRRHQEEFERMIRSDQGQS